MYKGIKSYKEKERSKFEQWLAEVSNPVYPVYIIYGNYFWKKEIIDRMSRAVGKRPEMVNENIKTHLDKMRYRSLKKKKHFVLFESKGNKLKAKDLEILKEYFTSPSENGILIISLKDRADRAYFLKNFRMIRRSSKIKFMEMNVSDYFKELYVRMRIDELGLEFENEKVKKDCIKNLILNMSELEDNLSTLQSLEMSILTKEVIKESIEEYSETDFDKLIDSLVKVNRKTVPYKLLEEMLSEGISPLAILKTIRKHFIYIYQAKYLKLRGIMRTDDIEVERKKVYENEGIIFKDPDIWDLPKRKRDKYLDDCEAISLKEIIYVLNIIDNHFTKKRIKDGDKYIYREYTTKEDLVKCVIEIMERRV